jgi:protein gp37
MSTVTKIEWADRTWNPLVGCERVSPGCDRCYAMGVARVRQFNPNPKIAAAFAGTTTNDGGVDWSGRVNRLDQRLAEPLLWPRKPQKVFVNSMSDLFHKDVPDSFIIDVFAVMALTPQHTYQILTKRHARMRSLLRQPMFWTRVGRQARHMGYAYDRSANYLSDGRNIYDTNVWEQLDRLPNVWLGVSVENQKWADIRIPALLDTPAAVRWISAEPLLGPVDLSAWVTPLAPMSAADAPKTWAEWAWPDWVPQPVREAVEGFWDEKWGRGPHGWDQRHAPAGRSRVRRDGPHGRRVRAEPEAGRWPVRPRLEQHRPSRSSR